MHAAHGGSGLNVVVLHFGLRNHDLADSRTIQALQTGSAAFYFFHAGLRIKAFLNEVYGTQAARYMENGGFRMAHDFQRDHPERFAGVPPEEFPYLFILRKEWMQPGAIDPLSHVFHALTSKLRGSPPKSKTPMNETEICVHRRESAANNDYSARVSSPAGVGSSERPPAYSARVSSS